MDSYYNEILLPKTKKSKIALEIPTVIPVEEEIQSNEFIGIPPFKFETQTACFLLWRIYGIPSLSTMKFTLSSPGNGGNVLCSITLTYNALQLGDVAEIFVFEDLVQPKFLPSVLEWNLVIPTENIQSVEKVTIPDKGIIGLKVNKENQKLCLIREI